MEMADATARRRPVANWTAEAMEGAEIRKESKAVVGWEALSWA